MPKLPYSINIKLPLGVILTLHRLVETRGKRESVIVRELILEGLYREETVGEIIQQPMEGTA